MQLLHATSYRNPDFHIFPKSIPFKYQVILTQLPGKFCVMDLGKFLRKSKNDYWKFGMFTGARNSIKHFRWIISFDIAMITVVYHPHFPLWGRRIFCLPYIKEGHFQKDIPGGVMLTGTIKYLTEIVFRFSIFPCAVLLVTPPLCVVPKTVLQQCCYMTGWKFCFLFYCLINSFLPNPTIVSPPPTPPSWEF